MRDLLTHFVRRTLRPELTVQPRLPSRYEPRGDAGATASDLDVGTATRRSAAPTDRTAAGRAPSPIAPPQPAREGDDGHVTPTQPRLQHDGPLTVRTGAAERRPSRSSNGADATSATPLVASRPSTAATLPRPHDMAHARDAERTIAPAARSAPQGRGATNPPEPTFVRSPLRAVTAAPRVDAMDGSAESSSATDGAGGRADEAPAPEIRISIGRIEVRATVADGGGARRPDRAAHQTQSLNDYLDARARGAGR